jgi:hypothetical protein
MQKINIYALGPFVTETPTYIKCCQATYLQNVMHYITWLATNGVPRLMFFRGTQTTKFFNKTE